MSTETEITGLELRLKNENKKLWGKLCKIKKEAEGIWDRPALAPFTFHQNVGIAHSERIIEYLNDLTESGKVKMVFPTEKVAPRTLTAEEIFILLSSAYLHDIGKKFPALMDEFKGIPDHKIVFSSENLNAIKKAHSSVSAKIIRAQKETPLPKGYEDLHLRDCSVYIGSIAYLCEKHMAQLNPSVIYDEVGTGIEEGKFPEEVEIPLLLALLQTADTIDFTYKRIVQTNLDAVRRGTLELPPRIEEKWWGYYYVDDIKISDIKIREDVRGKQIIASYRIPPNLINDFEVIREIAEAGRFDRRRGGDCLDLLNQYGLNVHVGLPERITDDSKWTVPKETLTLMRKKVHGVYNPVPIKKELERKGRVFDENGFPSTLSHLDILAYYYDNPTAILTAEDIGSIIRRDGAEVKDFIQDFVTKEILHSKTIRDKEVYEYAPPDEMVPRIQNFIEEYNNEPSKIREQIKSMVIEEYKATEEVPSGNEITKIETGIEGLDKIIKYDFPQNRCILVKGRPGTGKTVLCLQILYNNRKNRRGLYITFEEEAGQINRDASKFGWKLEEREITVTMARQIMDGFKEDVDRDEKPRKVVDRILEIIDETRAELLVIDSVSRFREMNPKEELCRQALVELIHCLKNRRITTLCIAEEKEKGSIEDSIFEEYLVDGIIKLSNKMGERYIEVSKLRGRDYAGGEHSFKITNSGINIFPNIKVHLDELKNKGKEARENEKVDRINSGVNGLDKLLVKKESKEEQGGFIKGSSILVAGDVGTGKTTLGLHFLNEGVKKEKDKENVLFVSLQETEDEIKKMSKKFKFELWKSENEERFKVRSFSPITLNCDEFVFELRKEMEEGKFKRAVIDNISDLSIVIRKEIDLRNFISSLAKMFINMGATPLFTFGFSKRFAKFEEAETEILLLNVDTIIMLGGFGIGNEIKKGLLVLKMRKSNHDNELKMIDIDEDGLKVVTGEWPVEGLLSGERKDIQIFLKLFYENDAEKKINEELIENFKGRYPTLEAITVLRPKLKDQLWDFEESERYRSNVKIVSLDASWIDKLIEKDSLLPLNGFIGRDDWLYFADKEEDRLIKYCTESDGDNVYAIPSYCDVDLLFYRKDIIKEPPTTWEELKTMVKEHKEDIEEKNLVGFALPSLYDQDSLINFFLEILWAHGGAVFNDKGGITINKKEGVEALDFIRNLIEKGIAPPPSKGDYSSNALFTIKQCSEIQNLQRAICEERIKREITEKDDQKSIEWKMKKCLKEDIIGVTELPYINNPQRNYSVYSVCCLGILKESRPATVAWKLIRELVKRETMMNRAKAGAGLPAIKELYDDVQVRRRNPGLYDTVNKIMKKETRIKMRADVKNKYIGNYEVLPVIYDKIKHVFLDEKDAQSMLDSAADEINKKFNEKEIQSSVPI